MDPNLLSLGHLLKNSSKPEQVSDLFRNLENIIYNENTSNDIIDFLLSKLFDQNDNIFGFIDERIQLKEWKTTTTITFKLIADIITKYPENVRSHFPQILKHCTKYATSQLSANEKEKTMSIIIQVLENGSGSIPTDDVENVYETFYNILQTTGKQSTATITKNVFVVIGVIARYYNSVVYNEKEVVNHYIRILDMTKAVDPGANLKIAGAFEGLTNIFLEFSFVYIDNNDVCSNLYKNVKKFTDYRLMAEKNRKNDCRSAIKFITKHPFVFSSCVTPSEFNWWKKGFHDMYLSPGENRKVGLEALLMFYKEIGIMFKTNTRNDDYMRSFEAYTDYFIDDLKQFQKNGCSENQQLRLSLYGISYFIGAFKTHGNYRRLYTILNYIATIMQQYYLNDEEEASEDVLEFLPDFVKCYSIILQEIDDITSEQMVILRRLAITTVKSYPKISTLYHVLIVQSLQTTLCNLYVKNPQQFNFFVRNFVHESVIWTCYQEYKRFLPLWRDLINPISYANIEDVDLKQKISRIVFDEMIKSLFVSTVKLDLETVMENNELKPSNPDDYVIFLHMTEFYNEILTKCDRNSFRRWIKKYSKHMILRSESFPSISGYYKLLSASQGIISEIDYFHNVDQKDTKRECFEQISVFLHRLTSRIRQYRGELQLSCIDLILKSPSCFAPTLLPIVSDVFEIVFTIGLNFPNIAMNAIVTLDNWNRNHPETKSLIEIVLPRFDSYLRTKESTTDIDFNTPKSRKTKRNVVVDTDSELSKLQRKIIEFVGRLHPETSTQLLKTNDKIPPVPWETKPNLKFSLPFKDVNVPIYFDVLVPRVVELALNCSNRKTRIAACEVLQGIVVVLLGTSRQMDGDRFEQYAKLFEILVKAIVELGCDSDQLVQDIFRELVLQMIHWYTSPAMLRRSEAITVVDVIMDGVSHTTNSALQEFSGQCIEEFLKWSIAQYDQKDALNVHANVKKIISKISSFCTHPEKSKRRGAAVAFNKLYVTFREEESMVDIFLLELLCSFVKNLGMAENREDIDEISKAIGHIERIFKEKSSLFNKKGNKRRVPMEFGGSELKDVLVWVLKRCGDKNVFCRRKCMELFENLYSLVVGTGSPKEFVLKYVDEVFVEKIDPCCDEMNFYRYVDFYSWLLQKDLIPFNSLDIDLDVLIPEAYKIDNSDIIKPFFQLVIQIYKNDSVINNSEVWKLLSVCIFEKHNWNLQILLNELNDNLPENALNEMNETINDYFHAKYDSKQSFNDQTVPNVQRQILKGLLSIQNTRLANKTISLPRYFSKSVQNVHVNLTIDITSQTLQYHELHLKLGLMLNNSLSTLWTCVTSKRLLNESLTYGSLFLKRFREIAIEFLTKNVVDVVENYFKSTSNEDNDLILDLIDHIARNRKRFESPQSLVDGIVEKSGNCFVFRVDDGFKQREFQVDFLLSLSKLTKRPFRVDDRLENWFKSTLLWENENVNRNSLVDFKLKMLGVIPCFLVENADENDSLSTLRDFVNRLIVLVNEINEFGDENVRLMNMYKRLLNVLVQSRNELVFYIVLETFFKINENVTKINEKIELYASKTHTNVQLKSLDILMDVFPNYELDTLKRYELMQTFSYPLLRNCTEETFETFYVKYICEIASVLKTETSTTESILNKTICFILIEILFERTNIEKLRDCSCAISQELLKYSLVENGLLKALSGCVRSVRKETFVPETEQKNLYRLYQCSAFNAFVSMITNTKTDPSDLKAYDYIFYENSLKNDYVWERIIDCDESIDFDLSFETLPEKIKILSKTRKTRETIPVQYVQSQNIYNSSLSEDISRYDFSNTSVRLENINVSESSSEIVVEKTDLNRHECMSSVCGTIQHLVDCRIVTLSYDFVPFFVEQIKKCLLNGSKNVRLFFCRVIHNMKHIFKYYSKQLSAPIIKTITSETFKNLNYFVADILTMLTEWNAIDNEPVAINDLISFLIENAHNDRKDILKFNQEIVKMTVDCWKRFITVPTVSLLEKLKSDRKQTAIQLIGIFLANDIVVWDQKSVAEYLSSLAQIIQIDRNYNEIQRSTAEVVGLTLKLMNSRNEWRNTCTLLEKQVKTILDKSEDTKFLQCLEHIQIHFPRIVELYIKEIYVKLTRNMKNGSLATICLKNLLRYVQTNANTPNFDINYDNLLQSTENDVVLLTLKLLEEITSRIAIRNISDVVGNVQKLSTSSNIEIRSAVYDFLIVLYEKNQLDSVKIILLRGLFDSDPDLREKLRKYWSKLPETLQERFKTIVSDLYTSETESFFLGYSVYFLLSGCEMSNEYNKVVFEYALKECRFEEQKLDMSWRSQHAFTTPSVSDVFVTPDDRNKPRFYGLRAQEERQFVPTLRTKTLTQSTSSFLFPTAPVSMDIEPTTLIERKVDNKIFVQHTRRFLSSRAKISKHFAKVETIRKNTRSSIMKERVKNRDLNVSIYRKYRKGDFPDIQITTASVIKPLQILADTDENIARHLFVMIYEQTSAKVEIENIFKRTNEFNPNLMSALLEICTRNPDIDVETDTIVSVGVNSGLLSTAALLLEKKIAFVDNEIDSKRRNLSTNENDRWLKLAVLYKEMGEWDVVKGIHGSKMERCSDNVMKAVHAETSKRWDEAAHIYEKLVESFPNPYYKESLYKCYSQMSNWKSIHDHAKIDITLNGFWKSELVLPWLFKSSLYRTLETQKPYTQFLKALETWMSDPDQAEYLKNNFSEELSLLALQQNDYKAARYYSNCCVGNFLRVWSGTSPLFTRIRGRKIVELQKINEINTYLDFIENVNGLTIRDKLDEIYKVWKTHNRFDSIYYDVTEFGVLYRKFVVNLLKVDVDRYMENDEKSNEITKLNELTQSIQFDFIKYGIESGNYRSADENINKLHNIQPGEGREGIEMLILKSKTVLMEFEKKNHDDRVNPIPFWKNLQNCYETKQPHNDLHMETCALLSRFATTLSPLPKYTENANDIMNKTMKNYSLQLLNDGIKTGETHGLSNVAKVYLEYVSFLKSLNDPDFENDIVECVFKSMKLGSNEARQQFPCLLQMLTRNRRLGKVFRTVSSTVPSWMFLKWIPQLLAALNVEEIGDLLIRLAEEYPQALTFPFEISRQTLDERLETIRKLDEILSNEIVPKFVFSLSCLCLPEVNFKYHVSNFLRSVCDKRSFVEHVESYKTDLGRKTNDSLSGKVFSQYKDSFNNYEKTLTKIANEYDVKTSTKWIDEVRKKLNDSSLLEKLKKTKSSTNLKDYSVWLCEFRGSENDFEIEIPGQYRGDRKPLPEYHIKLSHFNEKVHIYERSLRKPFRVVMYGNDAKPYEFLVKFGEDLRQDQRVQQLFHVMNDIIQIDRPELKIETYDVVPIRDYVGLIGCVGNAKTLSSFIHDSMNENERKECDNVSLRYQRWITSAPMKKRIDRSKTNAYYLNASIAYTRDQTVAKYHEFVNTIPLNILTKALQSLCIDVETFCFARQRFITSYSVMCLTNWILGIGDRHLDNILISRNTGRAIGIDFGYAFEVATCNFPVPELIPFRLTPHILDITEPLRESGFVDLPMIHALTSLRNNKNVVLSTMDVFVNEPSVGWMNVAKNKSERHEQTIVGGFDPVQKIMNAKRKLDGCNPVVITVEELSRGSLKDEGEYLEAYRAIAEGDSVNNVRSRLKRNGLNPEEQVECLIDQATDYNILGKAFRGLQMWL